jgi:hypothetical protein
LPVVVPAARGPPAERTPVVVVVEVAVDLEQVVFFLMLEINQYQ